MERTKKLSPHTDVIPDAIWQQLLAGQLPDESDSLATEASELVNCLAPLATTTSWVVAQLGQSLDGRIATLSGHSHYINGRASLTHLHRLRGLADAVVIGAGTADADDPQLNVRHVSGAHPTRVVLDPRGRVPMDRQVFQTNVAPTLHVVGSDALLPEPPETVKLLGAQDCR
ncbi:MAG: RibD family protein [Halomonas sp.]|nr:RibD family protein [Halomonas sp.]